MTTGLTYSRPKTFQEGSHYTLIDPSRAARLQQRSVRFLGYCPCPALVLVETETGEKIRCERENLYLPARD